jgi:hypothetical protein
MNTPCARCHKPGSSPLGGFPPGSSQQAAAALLVSAQEAADAVLQKAAAWKVQGAADAVGGVMDTFEAAVQDEAAVTKLEASLTAIMRGGRADAAQVQASLLALKKARAALAEAALQVADEVQTKASSAQEAGMDIRNFALSISRVRRLSAGCLE